MRRIKIKRKIKIKISSKIVGKTYWFECSKCGYRTKVSGGPDRGVNFFVQTIRCRDCNELSDAVTRLRIPEVNPLGALKRPYAWPKPKPTSAASNPNDPPTFQSVLNRLPPAGVNRFKWVRFKLRCPVASFHKVEPWNAPARCPKCGAFLDPAALPYRIWE